MFSKKIAEQPHNLADRAAQSAEDAIHSTQRVTNEALDSLSGTVQGLREQAVPLLDRVTEQASTLAQRGVDAVRDGKDQLREQAHRASDGTVGYIQHEPLKAMLMAAATGAALMALLSLLNRPRH